MRKSGWVLACIVPAALVGWNVTRAPEPPSVAEHVAAEAPAPAPATPAPVDDDVYDDRDDERSYVFRIPSGDPTALSCDEARTIVEQVRSGLAYAPEPVPAAAFATSTADWLDPHGFLSLAKDAPTVGALIRTSADLLADIERKRQRGCASANGPAAELLRWVASLREAFDRGRLSPASADASAAALEPLPPTAIAREAAEEIGRRAGAFEAAHGDRGRQLVETAARRFFPPLDQAGWAKVVLASAVRAYVPLVDPHGEWAPFDEESRIYEVDLASRPPSRLWGRAVPTAVGVRITESATPPLRVDDVVLSIAHVATAGLPLEQIDQLGFAASDARAPLHAVILRAGAIMDLQLGKREVPVAQAEAEPDTLAYERIAFGEGDVIVVAVRDVRDDLGDDLASLIAAEKSRAGRRLAGIILDLRGNGGGSTDGALGALSLFLPGAPLFAMKRRDGTVEIDRAPMPRERDRWTGPVATFVDATTASAAEMIAGALAAYRRGPSVGTTTFGKGCAQEYVDDDVHAGVLRLTTLVYALPDGSPVQRVGLVPQVRFPFAPAEGGSAQEREAKLLHSAPAWRGPDLRSRAAGRVDDAPWPAHGGVVGPCEETEVCRALRVLGSPKRPAAVAKN
jgi:carboxyl-terminal processing protease